MFPDLGGLALGVQTTVAHEARSARNVEGDNNPVSGAYPGNLRPDFLDDTHRFVAQNVTDTEEGAEHLVQVQVGTAQPSGRHFDDHVSGVLDGGVRYGVDPHVALAVPGQRPHGYTSFSRSSPDPDSANLRCCPALAQPLTLFLLRPCSQKRSVFL